MKKLISHEDLKELLDYDPLTGIFKRKKSKFSNLIGKPAGTLNSIGYMVLVLGGRKGHSYLLHRLAWFYVTGEWPKNQIDHVNRIRSDNRFENLRECSGSENSWNKGAQSNSKTGVRGISWVKARKKWVVKLNKGREVVYVDFFEDFKQAKEAWEIKSKEIYGEFAN